MRENDAQSVSVEKQPPDVLHKKASLKNVAIFTGKHLCWSLFLIKLQAFSYTTSFKKESNTTANITKRSNTLKQFFLKLLPNCLSVFDHFIGLALKELRKILKRLLLTVVWWPIVANLNLNRRCNFKSYLHYGITLKFQTKIKD